MTALLSGLASRKLTIAWLFLLSAFFLLAIGGEQTRLPLLHSIGLDTNEPLRSLPMLVLFGFFLLHLLLKPLAAWMERSKKHTIEEEPPEASPFPEGSGSPVEKRKKSSYTSVSIAEVKTLLPYQNLRAFLRFFHIELPEEKEKGEVVLVSSGRSRVLFLGLTLLGFFCLGASLFFRYSLFPPASMIVSSQPNQTQTKHPSPLKQWVHGKFSVWNATPIDWGASVKIRLTSAQKQERLLRSTKRIPDREARIKARWRLLQDQKNLQEKRSEWSVLGTQRIKLLFSTEETQKSLRLGEPKRVGAVFWTFTKEHNQLLLNVNSKNYTLTQGVPQSIETYRFVFQGILLKDQKPALWLFVTKGDKKQMILLPLEAKDHLFSTHSLRWLEARQIILVGQLKLRFLGVDFGAQLRYQPVYGVYLGWLGLALFFVGFLGAWWKTRYRMEILWGGDTSFVRIEGSGIKDQGRLITQTIQDALFFPIDRVAGPMLPRQSPKDSPSRPALPSPEPRALPASPAASKKTQQSEVGIEKKASPLVSSPPQTSQPPSSTIPPPLFVNETQEASPAISASFHPKPPSIEAAPAKKTPVEPLLSTTTPSSKPPQNTAKPNPSSLHPAPSSKYTAPSPAPSTRPSSIPNPPKEAPETPRAKTDEFAAPTSTRLPSVEENFAEATAVSHRPEMLQQIRQAPPREGAAPSAALIGPNTADISQSPKPSTSSALSSAFSPAPVKPVAPSSEKGLDMNALFGDISSENPSERSGDTPKKFPPPKGVEDDIDALFAKISNSKKP